MWQSFKTMPVLLKFLTGHALACFVLLLGVVLPNDSFNVDGRAVPYGELWSSGIGPMVALVGIAMPIGGLLMLRRARHARQIYLIASSSGLVLPYVFIADFTLAAVGVVFVALIAWYLFGNQSTQR